MRYKVLSIILVFMVSSLTALAQSQGATRQEQEQLQRVADELQRLQQLREQILLGRRLVIPQKQALNGGAWWTNTSLVAELGLTDDQKVRIQKAFDNHKEAISSDSQQLNKQEAQLELLLAADPIDGKAVSTQIDRVVQARGELERTNSVMTLEMREVLTGVQWVQLQASPDWRIPTLFNRLGIVTPNPGAPSGAGQRNSGQRQQ